MGCCTLLAMIGADLTISLADFSIAAAFLNSSPKEVPDRRWSAEVGPPG